MQPPRCSGRQRQAPSCGEAKPQLTPAALPSPCSLVSGVASSDHALGEWLCRSGGVVYGGPASFAGLVCRGPAQPGGVCRLVPRPFRACPPRSCRHIRGALGAAFGSRWSCPGRSRWAVSDSRRQDVSAGCCASRGDGRAQAGGGSRVRRTARRGRPGLAWPSPPVSAACLWAAPPAGVAFGERLCAEPGGVDGGGRPSLAVTWAILPKPPVGSGLGVLGSSSGALPCPVPAALVTLSEFRQPPAAV